MKGFDQLNITESATLRSTICVTTTYCHSNYSHIFVSFFLNAITFLNVNKYHRNVISKCLKQKHYQQRNTSQIKAADAGGQKEFIRSCEGAERAQGEEWWWWVGDCCERMFAMGGVFDSYSRHILDSLVLCLLWHQGTCGCFFHTHVTWLVFRMGQRKCRQLCTTIHQEGSHKWL